MKNNNNYFDLYIKYKKKYFKLKKIQKGGGKINNKLFPHQKKFIPEIEPVNIEYDDKIWNKYQIIRSQLKNN